MPISSMQSNRPVLRFSAQPLTVRNTATQLDSQTRIEDDSVHFGAISRPVITGLAAAGAFSTLVAGLAGFGRVEESLEVTDYANPPAGSVLVDVPGSDLQVIVPPTRDHTRPDPDTIRACQIAAFSKSKISTPPPDQGSLKGKKAPCNYTLELDPLIPGAVNLVPADIGEIK